MPRAALTLRIEPAAASRTAGSAILTNTGDSELRVWQTGNTWGDDALSFEASGNGSTARIVRKPQVYTRDVPASVALKPGERYERPFDLEDGTWEPADTIRAVQSPDVRLVAVYDVPRSADAVTQDVWIGKLRSEP